MGANDRQVAGSHYQKQKIQHWDYVIANDIPYMEAQVIKYVSRHRDKNGVQDLEKAQHFLEKLIEVQKAKLEAAVKAIADECTCPENGPMSKDCKVHTP